jgi:hypothetical protein
VTVISRHLYQASLSSVTVETLWIGLISLHGQLTLAKLDTLHSGHLVCWYVLTPVDTGITDNLNSDVMPHHIVDMICNPVLLTQKLQLLFRILDLVTCDLDANVISL